MTESMFEKRSIFEREFVVPIPVEEYEQKCKAEAMLETVIRVLRSSKYIMSDDLLNILGVEVRGRNE